MATTLLLLLNLLAQDGAVSGRVVDSETGEPVSGITVRLLRRAYDEFGIERINVSQSAVTDDRGQYRLSNVPSSVSFYIGTSSPTYGSTYYPAARNPSAAVALSVLAGEERNGTDLKVSIMRLAKIRGRVIDALRVRQPHLSSVRLIPRYPTDPSLDSTSTSLSFRSHRVNQDGSFEIADVPPGSYYVTGVRIDDEPNRSRSVARVEIDGEDINDFRLIAAEGHEINGRVRVEGPPVQQMNVVLKPLIDPASLLELPPAVRPNGRFSIYSLPSGKYRITVKGLPPDYYIKSARFGSVDVLEDGISLHGSVSATLDIVISNIGGRIEGTVVDATQKPKSGHVVLLVPEVPRPERSDLHKVTLIDANGRFSINGVAPGTYRIFTTEDDDWATYRDPAFIERFRNEGQRITITDGDLSTIELQSQTR